MASPVIGRRPAQQSLKQKMAVSYMTAIGGVAKESSQLGHLEIQEPTKPVRLKDQALLGEWQDILFRLQVKLKAALDNDRSNDAKAYSIAAGVATDKLLVLAGRPTSIVAGLHEVRHSLPQLAATLSRVAEIINVPVIEGDPK